MSKAKKPTDTVFVMAKDLTKAHTIYEQHGREAIVQIVKTATGFHIETNRGSYDFTPEYKVRCLRGEG